MNATAMCACEPEKGIYCPAHDLRKSLLKIRDALVASPIMFDREVGKLKDAIAEALIDAGVNPHGDFPMEGGVS